MWISFCCFEQKRSKYFLIVHFLVNCATFENYYEKVLAHLIFEIARPGVSKLIFFSAFADCLYLNWEDYWNLFFLRFVKKVVSEGPSFVQIPFFRNCLVDLHATFHTLRSRGFEKFNIFRQEPPFSKHSYCAKTHHLLKVSSCGFHQWIQRPLFCWCANCQLQKFLQFRELLVSFSTTIRNCFQKSPFSRKLHDFRYILSFAKSHANWIFEVVLPPKFQTNSISAC